MNPASQSTKTQTGLSDNLTPDIVGDIPIAVQGDAKPINEDDELDKIMQDVGKDVNQVGKKKPKHGLFHRQKKPKVDPKFSAHPTEKTAASPAPARPLPTDIKPPTRPSAPAAKPVLKAGAQPKPPKTSEAPIGVIFLAVLITGALIAAAYYTYK